ncbi:dipeptidase [Actinomadura madurae]|uniref:dipeptidase n=1 Tax=Actinomadura madurae TaxID=1993 RepID=UPI0020265DB4|nr:dipeptidase [Actinomadura madurae]MCP9954012.1 dipeptidase [Actinomadura madurae]MCP9970756.1 dipeptidase [Actinomadura madurae]MCP9983230.1 dipeptidase [Actinomadura madurae]URM99489.1 dipeptidase [Actinomadura madurae]URN10159.1 dipeptidase [Actinomadura madurae]
MQVNDIAAYIRADRDRFVADLKEWLAIPSVSGDPAHTDDVHRSAKWLTRSLRDQGFPIVEVWETGGHPAVYAEWPADDPDAPAVVVYGHHDVQPVEPLDEWDTDPFTPVEKGDRLIGRGASDDKGQVFFHTLGIRALLAASGRQAPPVTVKLLVEGEEESGSVHFADLLRTHRDRLACDAVVISDTTMWAEDVPSMCTGMRGLTEAEVTLRGPDGDLHSGSFGGAVPNPLHAMAELLASLHDADGRVTLPGFYDDVVPLTDEERELFARLPFDEDEWLRTAGDSRAAHGEKGYTTLERVWARPTAEINGMWGGHTGPGGKTIVPREAHAKISFRLAAGQDPGTVQDQFRRWVAERTPHGVEAEVRIPGGGVRPCFSPIGSPGVKAARRAMERAFGTEVLFTREGGSGPEADLADILEAPLIFVAVGLDGDRIHAPNEKVEIPLLLKGAEAAAYLWEELAAALR